MLKFLAIFQKISCNKYHYKAINNNIVIIIRQPVVTTGFGHALVWIQVIPSMLYVKTKCRTKKICSKLSWSVSLSYTVATSSGEIVASYLAGSAYIFHFSKASSLTMLRNNVMNHAKNILVWLIYQSSLLLITVI